MMSIDPTDEDDSGDERSTGRATPAHSGHRSPADAEAGGEGDTVDGIQITERPSGDGDLVVRIISKEGLLLVAEVT